MGIAIIKGEFGANALGRTMHNLTPKDPNRRKSFTNNDLKNTRWEEVNGVYKVAYINLGQATQHYKYVLCDSQGNELQSQTGVSINQISGDITLDSNYDGSAVYAKVVPIIDNYYSTAISTTAVLVVDESGYTLDFAYNNSQGITARPQEVSMTSFAIYEDDTVVTNDKSELSNASVVVKENGNTIFSSNNINTALTIPGNTSSTYRDLTITVQGTYNGVPVSKSFVLPQGADAIDTISTISYSGSLVKGTTIDPSNFETTATYLSGKTPSQLQGTSVTPNTIQNSTATYTVTFEGNRSGQIELIPEDSQVTAKAYISGIPLQTAEGAQDGPYPGPTAGTHQWPLHVQVTRVDNTVENKTFAEYLALNEPKETYSSPVLTFADAINYNTMATVDSNGTLIYDFTLDNYVYDGEKTKINSIQISCTSDQSKSVSYTGDGVRINAEVQDSSYFTENFNAVPLSTDNVLQEIQTNAYHVEAGSASQQNKIVLDNGGTVYKLKPATDYYFKVSVNTADNKDYGFGGIISRTPNTSTLSASPYNRTNTSLVVVPDTNRIAYVHHTPTIESGKTYEDYVTYFVDGYPNSSDTYLNIEVLIPKNNN